ncbi:MAG: chromate transporter [Clostridia bacterium]|nr:chromate transporter [Clostridia bacterium]
MIYLKLFLSFLEIGAVSFGGGYGMISLIRETVIKNGWLTEDKLLNFIAVSESTPGPIAINMATFIGSAKGGVLGAFLATLGVVLPSFIIILIIASLASKLLENTGVKAFLFGVKPCIVALIIGTAATMGLSSIFGISAVGKPIDFDYRAVIILAVLLISHIIIKYVLKKPIKPILMIIISALLGIAVYAI